MLVAQPGHPLPTQQFSSAGQYTTPYHQSTVSFVTLASELAPRIFKSKTVPFNSLRLLGPLSLTPKWYHPTSSAFSESRKRDGKFPSSVPLAIEGAKMTFNLRRRGGVFVDVEGFEQALLENGRSQELAKGKK